MKKRNRTEEIKPKKKVEHSDEIKDQVIRLYQLNHSRKEIQKLLELPKETVNRWIKKFEKTNDLDSIHHHGRDYTFTTGPNAKITPEYLKLLEEFVAEEDYSYNSELIEKLFKKTGIKLSESAICKLKQKIDITKKVFTPSYPEEENPKNIEKLKIWQEEHHPKTGFIPYHQCMSTDEKKFLSNIIRRFGYKKIRRTHKKRQFKLKKFLGSSYRKNDTRVHHRKSKHAKASVHVAATISMHPDHPLPAFEPKLIYFNGGEFADFLERRKEPEYMIFDMLDRSSIHRCVKANIKRKKKPIH